MGRPSPAVPMCKAHKVKVTMDNDFNVKEDDMEFYAQPYLFKPKYSDQELREMTKNTHELTTESEDISQYV